MLMKKILVALDYGDTCDTVFDQGLGLALVTQASLNLLSVLAPESDDSITFSPYSDQGWAVCVRRYREIEAVGINRLKNFDNKAQAAGINTEFTQEIGNPGPTICKLAKTWDADLIIVGSHGRKGLEEILLGSVSNYVVHHAPCSVMVVHKRI
ncbi:MAG: universal stress protein [Cyanobacteria bacterium P01_F01_bin.3]